MAQNTEKVPPDFIPQEECNHSKIKTSRFHSTDETFTDIALSFVARTLDFELLGDAPLFRGRTPHRDQHMGLTETTMVVERRAKKLVSGVKTTQFGKNYPSVLEHDPKQQKKLINSFSYKDGEVAKLQKELQTIISPMYKHSTPCQGTMDSQLN